MKDTYNNFKDLSSVEEEGVDFQIFINNKNSRLAIIAPHGGGIEPGTSEIAKSIAGEDFTCYCFEGVKNKENKRFLHITSTNFDEPKGIEIFKSSDTVVTIHGADRDDEIVYVGGLNEQLKHRIIERLKDDSFEAKEDTTNHSGKDISNICNKGLLKQGLQLEISNGLRKKMYRELEHNDRNFTTAVFDKFIKSIRAVLGENKL